MYTAVTTNEPSKIDFKIFENENARIIYHKGLREGNRPLQRVYITEEMMLMWDYIGNKVESLFLNQDDEYLSE